MVEIEIQARYRHRRGGAPHGHQLRRRQVGVDVAEHRGLRRHGQFGRRARSAVEHRQVQPLHLLQPCSLHALARRCCWRPRRCRWCCRWRCGQRRRGTGLLRQLEGLRQVGAVQQPHRLWRQAGQRGGAVEQAQRVQLDPLRIERSGQAVHGLPIQRRRHIDTVDRRQCAQQTVGHGRHVGQALHRQAAGPGILVAAVFLDVARKGIEVVRDQRRARRTRRRS